MKTFKYKIQINALPENVWKTLWEVESYKLWTNSFSNGSYYKTDRFIEGNKINFLSPNGQGMYSIFDKNEINKFLAIRHLGSIHHFEVLPIDKETETWTNAMEIYSLSKIENGAVLTVSVDPIETHLDFMNKTFPLALNELKNISEIN